MEHRRDHRIPNEQAVSLTVLGDAEMHVAAIIKNISGHGLGLVTSEPVPSGAPVKIEFEDSIYLGEAIYCKPMEDGFFLGIKITEVLSGLAALSRIAEEFTAQLEPAASRRR
jgi:hypothetical protein